MATTDWRTRNRVVYYDENCPTWWIPHSTALIIANHLSGCGFVKVNADMLAEWMECHLGKETGSEAVAVLSQDVAPESVFHDITPDCLARRFLEAGGRIVWIGEVPFFRRGRAKVVPITVQVPGGEMEVLGLDGQYAVLGFKSSLVIPDGQVRIKRKGQNAGLKSAWFGVRPVSLRNLRMGAVLIGRESRRHSGGRSSLESAH